MAHALDLPFPVNQCTTACSPHLKRVVLDSQVLCQDVQHPHHLREDQDSVTPLTQPGQQLVQEN